MLFKTERCKEEPFIHFYFQVKGNKKTVWWEIYSIIMLKKSTLLWNKHLITNDQINVFFILNQSCKLFCENNSSTLNYFFIYTTRFQTEKMVHFRSYSSDFSSFKSAVMAAVVQWWSGWPLIGDWRFRLCVLMYLSVLGQTLNGVNLCRSLLPS